MIVRSNFFPGQQKDEEIVLVLREHWFFLVIKLFIWLLFTAILLVAQNFIARSMPQLLEEPYVHYVDLIRNVYVMFLMLGLFTVITLYYLNVQIVTNERIVDIDQHSIFSRVVSELHLEKIEDVTSQTKGFLGTALRYGYVYIQTAGATERFTFENIANPELVSKVILDLYEKRAHKIITP
jgi:hypothetical protein